MNNNLKHHFKVGFTIAAITLVSLTIVFSVSSFTKEKINNSKRDAEIARFAKLLPQGSFNNNPMDECFMASIFTKNPTPIYLAKMDDKVSGYVITYDINGGYGTPFIMIAGVDSNFNINYADIVEFNETPGLGDKVLRNQSNFLDSLSGKGLKNSRFDVKKYDGDFDYFTGATVTPRAIVRSTKDMLLKLETLDISKLERCK